jgi:cell division septation protein DedD
MMIHDESGSQTTEEAAFYEAYRLARGGGANERIAFASAAIDLINARTRAATPRALEPPPVKQIAPVLPPVTFSTCSAVAVAEEPTAASSVFANRETREVWLKTVSLAALGMAVMLIAGGTAARRVPLGGAEPANPPRLASAPTTGAWVVQVAAFSNHGRSLAMVERLVKSGFEASATATRGSRGPLYLVRVGPLATATEADEALARLRRLFELDGPFVRNITLAP